MKWAWFPRLVVVGIVSVCGLIPLFAEAAEISVEITGAGRRQIKVAIPPLVVEQGADDALNVNITSILRRDLLFSGFFDPMNDQLANIELLHDTDLRAEAIQFKRWAELGARLLVGGNYALSGDMVKIEFRLYDTLGGDFLLGKRYESNTAQLRDVIHRFADEIVLKMTGKKGMSTTKIVFVSDRSGSKELFQVDFDGENLSQLTHDQSMVLSPAVSPDGKKICYTSYKDNNPDLYVLSVESKQVQRVGEFPGLNFAADWAPDNQTLALTLSKDGYPELYLLDSVSREIVRVTNTRWNEVSPSWSPDGSQIVYTADQLGAPQIYVMNRDGSKRRRLTFQGSYNVSPAWSPTGERIAFASSMDGNFNIYTVRMDGDDLQQLTTNAGNNEDPAWSPDGRYLAFQSTRGGTKSIYIMNADGTNQRRLTSGGADFSPAWMQ